MKIKLEGIYEGGAYWRVEHLSGKIDYVLGFKEMKKVVEKAKEPVEVEPSLALKEHSKLLDLVRTLPSEKSE